MTPSNSSHRRLKLIALNPLCETCHPNPARSDVAEFIYVDPQKLMLARRFPGHYGLQRDKVFHAKLDIVDTLHERIDERV